VAQRFPLMHLWKPRGKFFAEFKDSRGSWHNGAVGENTPAVDYAFDDGAAAGQALAYGSTGSYAGLDRFGRASPRRSGA